MKTLLEYVEEQKLLETKRRSVTVTSENEKERSALYDLKKKLDSIDQLTDFKYIGRRGKEKAKAVFEVKDRDLFDKSISVIRENKGVKLEVL